MRRYVLVLLALAGCSDAAATSPAHPPGNGAWGGAAYTLSRPVDAPYEGCPDDGRSVYIASGAPDGTGSSLPLMVDGLEGAWVRCIVGPGTYDISVGSVHGAVTMIGTYAPSTLRGVTSSVTFVTPGGRTYSTETDASHPPCTVDVADASDGRFSAVVSCPYLLARPEEVSCSVAPTVTFVQFVGCKSV